MTAAAAQPIIDSSHVGTDFHTLEPLGLDAISTLTAGIAHEINTPIQFISDNLIYLKRSLEALTAADGHQDAYIVEKPETLDWIAALVESLEGIQSISDIVTVMKTFASSSECEFESVDLGDMIRGIVKLCRGRDLDIVPIELKLCEDLSPILAAKGPVQQALTNILVNAVDAVIATKDPKAEILITSRMNVDSVEIIISDQGIGIPFDIRHKIFLPFFTTKPPGEGTGTGLALAVDIITKRHGGSLSFTAVDGYQTSFLITLPVDPNNNQKKEDTNNVKAI
ncbi:MAG: ATP-binding protein [Pseudomonadota bacterium]